MDQIERPHASPGERKLRQRHLLALPHWVARGAIEMIRARFLFGRLRPSDITRLNREGEANKRVARYHPETVSRVAFIIPWLGRRLPWRSDCLIQAIAGQNWLASFGLASQIRIGADKPAGEPLDAHAWLVHEGSIVTGGNVDRFALLIGESDTSPDVDKQGTG